MRPAFIVMISLWIGMALPLTAEVYRYVDDQGVVHYTNELSTVPEDKLPEVKAQKEDAYTDGSDSGSRPAPPSYPRGQSNDAFEKSRAARTKELQKRKEALEKEYQKLLKEKRALDNDDGFQSRKNKRKYQNRPYIKALVEKERAVTARLLEIETELKNLADQK